MKYSKEEKEKIMEGLRNIQNWIEREIQPYLKESIVVEFGDYIKRDYIKERQYELIVKKDDIIGTNGGLRLLFNIKDWQKDVFGWIDVWQADYYALNFGSTLMVWWQNVKCKLLDLVYEQKRQTDAIMNFNV